MGNRLKLLILVGFVSLLAACAQTPSVVDVAPSIKAADIAEAEARAILIADKPALSPALLHPCERKVKVPKVKDLPEDRARELWNVDRARADGCYFRHANLVKQIKARNQPIPVPARNPKR